MDSFVNSLSQKYDVDEPSKNSYAARLLEITTHSQLRGFLRNQLSNYDSLLAQALSKNEFLDTTKARELKLLCNSLLDWCDLNLESRALPYVLAGVAYFLDTNDGHNDFEALDGLDDDAKILESIMKEFSIQIQKES